MSELSALVQDSPTAEETVGRIAREIEAFVNGGPDVEHEHLALDDIDTVSVQSSWGDARKRKSWIDTRKAAAKAKAEKARVEREKVKAEVAKAESVRVASADSSTDGGWGKRRSLGEERLQDVERVQEEEQPAAAKAGAPKAEKAPKEAEPEPKSKSDNAPGSAEEAYTEDSVNAANDALRRIWRIPDALRSIKPDAEMLPKVGGVLWRLSERNREVGCAVWVEWLKAHGVDDATARAQWAKGFGEGWSKVEDLYAVAQRNGWRYPVAQNLNRLDEIVERVEGALVRVGVDLYQSGGKLVRPVSVMVDATKGRKTRIARLVDVEAPFLKAELTKYVDFFSWKKEVRSPASTIARMW